MFFNRKYILHSESDNGINQWHFTNVKILDQCLYHWLYQVLLLIGADYVASFYDKRLKEFKSNYASVAGNISEIQSRLKELDQILEIEEKDRAVILCGDTQR